MKKMTIFLAALLLAVSGCRTKSLVADAHRTERHDSATALSDSIAVSVRTDAEESALRWGALLEEVEVTATRIRLSKPDSLGRQHPVEVSQVRQSARRREASASSLAASARTDSAYTRTADSRTTASTSATESSHVERKTKKPPTLWGLLPPAALLAGVALLARKLKKRL